KVTDLATDTSREKSKLVFDRHEPETGELWWIIEDVCNNFSTTDNMIQLILERGARVAGIGCFLDRSMKTGATYVSKDGTRYPVVSLVRKIIEQYDQDDPLVKDDIDRGNVIWKPKNNWTPLEEAMKNASSVE